MEFNYLAEEFLTSSSSSSSSEEFDNFLQVIIPEVLQTHPKNELYYEHTVPLYNDKEFSEHFKVPRQVLQQLATEFEMSEYYPKVDSGFMRLPAEKYILIFCWFASHEAASFRDVSDRFNVAVSTLHIIINDVGLFLSSKSATVITWPSQEEQLEITREFQEIGFPNVLGCIDGTHIRIDEPKYDPDSYRNRKKYFSVQVQAVCDSKKRIRDIFIGFPGSVHDARVFRNSPLKHTLVEKCGDNYILGDSAYPCLRNLMTPYRDTGNLIVAQRNFNKKLCHVRVIIEHTFGMLKQKFRQLYHLKLRDMTNICHFIRACCVLYNLTLGVEEDLEGIIDPNQQVLEANDNADDEHEGDEMGLGYRNYLSVALNL